MQRIRRTVTSIAESSGATAEVTFSSYSPPNTNDPALTKAMEPTLRRVALSQAGNSYSSASPSQ
jgi:metal-dependent amidase/aminoacylase/carboxypeptidase family protein